MKKYILFIIGLAVIVVGGLLYYYTINRQVTSNQSNQSIQQDINLDFQSQKNKLVSSDKEDNINDQFKLNDEQFIGESLDNIIFYLKGGDIYSKEKSKNNFNKITNSGLITNAELSPDKLQILFIGSFFSSDIIYSAEQKKDIEISSKTKKLFLYNIKTDEIKDLNLVVNHWGWIPSSNDFYYETVSLQPFYGSGEFLGDRILYRFHSDTGMSTVILDRIPQTTRPFLFSPDGENIAYITNVVSASDTINIDVKNLKSLKVIASLQNIDNATGGAGSGAPLAIWPYFWNSDGKTIITAVVSYNFNDHSVDLFAEGIMEIWELSIQTNTPKMIYSNIKTYIDYGIDFPKFTDSLDGIIYRNTTSSLDTIYFDKKFITY